jgi:xanthine dehydrogenase accessory factor
VEIYLDPILPAARLLIFGASPIARALARLGQAMGYSVSALMDAAADQPAAAAGAGAAAAGPTARGASYAVVATMGERDEEAIRAALALRPAYLGVVASAKRFAQVRESLLAQGVAAAALDSIRSPAGVAIGAQEPAEIAVSVLAEIVARRHAGAERPETTETSAAAASPETPGTPEPSGTPESGEIGAAGQALDPVCGMTVETAGARHTAEAGGRTWYFCCGGCRERFLAAPERFVEDQGLRGPGAPWQPRRSSEVA